MQTAKESCICKRWAFSLRTSMEDEKFESNFRKAIQMVTKDDYEKICRYRHKEDSLACLGGRLLLRKAIQCVSSAQWADIEIARTDRGKPYIVRPEGHVFGLNVSHQGDYVVFAGSCSSQVGVDVMRLDMCRGTKNADEYINSMAKSASAEELRTMRGQPTEQMKMTVFYRYWCLKEAILKATGQGMVDDLSRFDFRIDPADRYKQSCFLTSTTLLLDGKPQPQWVFEESFVDATHVVAVCREKKLPASCIFKTEPEAKLFFTKIPFDFLLDGATVLNPLSDGAAAEYNNFMEKPTKKF